MIECSFCSSSKSERYLYTKCNHFVCMNCAALRAGETLQCCNIATQLQGEVKAELNNKKQSILKNLQNEYEYERTDVNKIGFGQIEDRLRKIDIFESKSRRKYQQDADEDQNQYANEQMQSTPMNEFYKNPLILKEPKYEIQQSTPIKLVTNADFQDDYEHRLPQKSSFNPVSQRKVEQNKYQSTKVEPMPIYKEQFIPILQSKIHQVREEFKGLYDQLQKMEANIVYQMKIYFEEYVHLIEKQTSHSLHNSSSVSIEKQRVDSFLNQFVEKWKIKELKNLLSEQQSLTKKLPQKQQTNLLFEKAQEKKFVYTAPIQPLQSCRLNYPISPKKSDIRDQYLDRLRFSQSLQGQNIIRQPVTTGRNLDKIYRKLQESRSKLEQRIQIHNEFMNKRCVKMGNY